MGSNSNSLNGNSTCKYIPIRQLYSTESFVDGSLLDCSFGSHIHLQPNQKLLQRLITLLKTMNFILTLGGSIARL